MVKGSVSARRVAVELLSDIEAGRLSTQDLFFDKSLSRLERSDRALAYELVLGTLRWKLALDWLIETSSGRKLRNITPALRPIIRTSIFQMRFLARVPEYAAVNEAVQLARKAGPREAGFVNAVLRSYGRTKPELPAGDRLDEQSIRTSHPAWLLRRWRERYGSTRTEQIAARNNEPFRPAIRWNEQRSLPDSLRKTAGFRSCRTLGNCFYAESIPSQYIEGEDFVYQDEASQMAAFIPPEDGRILSSVDVCAAPGGKAFILAERFPAALTILADRSFSRLSSTRERARRWGMEAVLSVVYDASAAAPFRRCFDLVFVDAPCSGLGTIRRNPEIKWRVRESSLGRQQQRQKAILRQSAQLVARGGRMVYTTCSTEPEENEQVVKKFLDENRDFEPEPIQSPELKSFVSGAVYSTMDDYPDMDGFFGYLLRRKK